MSNHEGTSADLEVIPRDVRKRIEQTLTSLNRPVSWLASETGIANSTLDRGIKSPGDLKLRQLIAISFALDVDFGWLAYGDCPTCGGAK
jgi:hypothetical protein